MYKCNSASVMRTYNKQNMSLRLTYIPRDDSSEKSPLLQNLNLTCLRSYQNIPKQEAKTRCNSYEVFFVIMWGSAVLSIPAAIGLFVWLLTSFWTYDDDHALRVTFTLWVVGLLMFYTCVLRRHGFRVMIRAGAFPFFYTGKVFPRSLNELKVILQKYKREHKSYTVIGGGWSHFLWRKSATGVRVVLHKFHGKRDRSEIWNSGTTIAEVQKHYKFFNKSLAHFPTMDYISIGAWVACCNHGNTGDHNKNTVPIKNVYILNVSSGYEKSHDLKSAQRLMATNNYISPDLIITGVEFNLVSDIKVQKKLVLVKNSNTAKEWLKPGANLRMMFMGGTRDYAMALRWDEFRQNNIPHHIDPHLCSRMCLFLQADVFSVVGGFHESPDKFNGVSSLSDANKWTPPIYPFMTVAVVLSGIKNFEIFFRVTGRLNEYDLSRFVQSTISMHKNIGGRSELRYDDRELDTIVYWDISLSSYFNQPFKVLYSLTFNQNKVTHVALHPGKFDDLTVYPFHRQHASSI